MKEEMTSFDIAATTSELNQLVEGAYVDNIYQIAQRALLFKLRRPGRPRLHLLVEAGRRFHLTSYVVERPSRPSSFSMALRKHLRNGVVTKLKQHRFERIIVLGVKTKEGEFQLVSELFGGGNIILVDPQDLILHALTYRRMRDRNVLRGEAFQHAPPSGRNPLELNRQDFGEIRKLGKLEIVRALTKFLSIGGVYAEEILLRARVDKDISCASLKEPEAERIFDQLEHVLSLILAGKAEPCIIITDKGDWVDVAPFPLEKYACYEKKLYKNFNEALDEYYAHTSLKESVAKVSNEVDRELAKQQRIVQSQKSASKELKARIERNKKIGDTIYMHLNNLQFLLHRINDDKEQGKPWETIVSDIEKEKAAGVLQSIHFHSIEPKRRVITVEVGSLIFPLNLRRSVQVNAATYYAKAKKAAKKLEGAEKALQETQTRIRELQQKHVAKVEETRRPRPKRRKKAWYEKFRWFHSSDSFLVIGGRDATTNELLVKKHMESRDVVFHADIQGAPFVLIKTEGKIPPEGTLREAAQLAASYSRAWREMFDALDVYWVTPQQVDKSPPSGQYLKKGSFMIHGSKNYARNVPLKVAIGVNVEDDNLLIVGGPPQAISKQADTCVEIAPGEHKSSEIAKQIRKQLAAQAPEALRKQILEIPLEDIQRFIPLGKGRLI